MAAKITADVGKAIRAAKKAGSTNVDCVAIVRERFGIVVDRRSIDRYLAQAVTKPPKTEKKPAAPRTDEPVDELADLETSVRTIRALMRERKTAREYAQLNAELRQTHAQIRAVKADAKGGKSSGPDVSELRKQLIRAFAPTEGEAAIPDGEAAADDRSEVPDVQVASGASSAVA